MSFPWAAWRRAFLQASPHSSSWVHLGTLEVKRFNPRRLGAKKAAAAEEAMYADEQWVEVPYAESDDDYNDMRAFSTSPACGKASRDLLMALADPKPFRAFRVALKQHETAAKAWHDNRLAEADKRLWAFCRAYELSPDHPQFRRLDAELSAEPEGC